MVEHKRLVYILAVGFFFMTATALIFLFWPDPVAPEILVSVKSVEPKSKPSLGKPCNYKGGEELDTKNLQCYFYGEANDRKGIWIIPDMNTIKFMPSNFKTNIVWESYANVEYGLSFQYPEGAVVSEVKIADEYPWEVKILASETDPIIYSQMWIKTKEDSKEDIWEDEKNINEWQEFISQSGLKGQVRKTIPNDTTHNPFLEYKLDLSDKYYLWVTYDRGLGSDIDYINDSIVQSLKVIN